MTPDQFLNLSGHSDFLVFAIRDPASSRRPHENWHDYQEFKLFVLWLCSGVRLCHRYSFAGLLAIQRDKTKNRSLRRLMYFSGHSLIVFRRVTAAESRVPLAGIRCGIDADRRQHARRREE